MARTDPPPLMVACGPRTVKATSGTVGEMRSWIIGLLVATAGCDTRTTGVTQLPVPPKGHPHADEWRRRANSSNRLLAYLRRIRRPLRIVERLKPRRAFFTHICHDLSHAKTNAALPPHVRLAHDGLKVQFEF